VNCEVAARCSLYTKDGEASPSSPNRLVRRNNRAPACAPKRCPHASRSVVAVSLATGAFVTTASTDWTRSASQRVLSCSRSPLPPPARAVPIRATISLSRRVCLPVCTPPQYDTGDALRLRVVTVLFTSPHFESAVNQPPTPSPLRCPSQGPKKL
jgi:hypothetical protein